eukprot:3380172-Amphidinium_carterae.1
MRVTVAQFLASKGIDIGLIMLLARWRSQVVYRYAQLQLRSTLVALTRRFQRATLPTDAGPTLQSCAEE